MRHGQQRGGRPRSADRVNGVDRPTDSDAARSVLIHEWNGTGAPARTPKLLDETLRDGLQSASVRAPAIHEKVSLLHAAVRLGVDAAAIGMPSAGGWQCEHALYLAREVASQNLSLRLACAARTRLEDIAPVVEVSQKAGLPIEAGIFVGTSPIRQLVDGRGLAELQRMIDESVRFATEHGLPVMFVAEDSTRSTPEVLRAVYSTAIRAGAERLCVADTVGHATPSGAARIVQFVASLVNELAPGVEIDWHGHRDRGLSVANSLAAWAAGAERCHGTALGVGERSGNTPMELLLVNLQLLGWINRDLSSLSDYCNLAAQALDIAIAPNSPVTGVDAFRTATGVHARALARALPMGIEIYDSVYSAVPATMVGRSQQVEIGPMSGRSNVLHYLADRGVAATDQVLQLILGRAKEQATVLSEEEVLSMVPCADP
jgi:2-isopropylmalate synthase